MISQTLGALAIMGAEGAFSLWAGKTLGIKLSSRNKKRRAAARTIEPVAQDEAGTVRWGWNVLQAMSDEIHSLYHPPGCKCAMCEITADDDQAENAYNGEYCSQPCFGCTVLTCKTHPDLRPPKDVTKPPEKKTGKTARAARTGSVKFQHQGHDAEYWYNQAKRNVDIQEFNRMKTALKNVDDQLKALTEAYKDKIDEIVTLRYELGQTPMYSQGDYEPVRYVKS